ncbi:hypothetical protein BaRGS_00027494 [Batillaria attramentaria]|uniref:C2H2-type domain-containing protein n=1 Tax=Batillaria attramentaria TaxID=370345 RepID=A0ABD0K1Y5_9CAEN
MAQENRSRVRVITVVADASGSATLLPRLFPKPRPQVARFRSLIPADSTSFTGPSSDFTGPSSQAGRGAGVSARPGQGRHTCRSCGKSYTHKQNMLRHRRICEGTCHLRCESCGREFHRRDLYSDHLRVAHVHFEEVPFRRGPTRYGAESQRHRQANPPTNPTRVVEFAKDMTLSSQLTAPEVFNLEVGQDERLGDRHVCRNCGKTYAHGHSMLRHRRHCEGTYHLKCDACGRLFHRRDLFSDHLKVVHGIQDKKRPYEFHTK